jgi:UDP-N-acetylglucosamine transferase subunit ALG13
MTTVVLVGNRKEPFNRLLDAVAQIAFDLPQPVVVQFGNTPFGNPACQCHAFFDRDTLSSLIETSQVVICHAGAGCVIDILRAGRMPVVMPRRRAFGEVIDDHQSEFAAMLLEAQKAIVVHGASDLQDGVSKALAMNQRSKSPRAEPPLVALVRDVLRAVSLEVEAKRP